MAWTKNIKKMTESSSLIQRQQNRRASREIEGKYKQKKWTEISIKAEI